MNNSSQQPGRSSPSRIDLHPRDPGYYYDPHVEAGLHGKIKLSPRVEHHCKCGGKPPYQIFENPDVEPVWCPCRSYQTKIRQINRFIAESGIPAPFRYKFIDDFHESYDGKPIPGADQLKQHLRTLTEKARSREASSQPNASTDSVPPLRGYFLWGKPGAGKTYFSYIALNELIFYSVRPGKFISLSKEFFQTLRFAIEEKSPLHGQSETYINILCKVPFLVIDDFGVQRNTEWELEMLYNLVDTRYANRRFTMITTNQDIESIKDLADGRLYSRFLEMCYTIHIQAPDYREHFKKEYEI